VIGEGEGRGRRTVRRGEGKRKRGEGGEEEGASSGKGMEVNVASPPQQRESGIKKALVGNPKIAKIEK